MKQYAIENEYLSLKFLDLGGRITQIKPVFFDGNLVLAYPEIQPRPEGNALPNPAYLDDKFYLGAIIGRVANRISGGVFSLGGTAYTLDKNENGVNCLHSGKDGYHAKVFEVFPSSSSAVLTLRESGGGFPGKLFVKIKYALIGSSLSISYFAQTDSPTPVNLTNHMYFDPSGLIGDCEAKFFADFYTPADGMIPTGEILPVAGTPLDFREYKKIGADIDSDSKTMKGSNGYDHNFVIKGYNQDENKLLAAAEVYMPNPDITLSVTTKSPGFQFYTGNFLSDPFEKRSGFCVETQFFPDTPNKSNFPACTVTPDKPFRSKTIYTFTKGRV
ncbi:MAG: aldose epimerase family protein [Eubacteriales bacterium]